MLAETVQSHVGAFFGVSGTVVVFVVALIVLALVSNSEDQKKEAAANLAKQRAAVSEAEAERQRARLLANPITQVCSDGRHNECNGNVRTSSGAIRQCSCTCHGGLSDNCSTKGRHDLCNGTVNGSSAPCRCTCHMPRT